MLSTIMPGTSGSGTRDWMVKEKVASATASSTTTPNDNIKQDNNDKAANSSNTDQIDLEEQARGILSALSFGLEPPPPKQQDLAPTPTPTTMASTTTATAVTNSDEAETVVVVQQANAGVVDAATSTPEVVDEQPQQPPPVAVVETASTNDDDSKDNDVTSVSTSLYSTNVAVNGESYGDDGTSNRVDLSRLIPKKKTEQKPNTVDKNTKSKEESQASVSTVHEAAVEHEPQPSTPAASTPPVVASTKEKETVPDTAEPSSFRQRRARRKSTGGMLASAGPPSIEWTKPSWIAAKLKPTEKGTTIKQGKCLQKPITKIRDVIAGSGGGATEDSAARTDVTPKTTTNEKQNAKSSGSGTAPPAPTPTPRAPAAVSPPSSPKAQPEKKLVAPKSVPTRRRTMGFNTDAPPSIEWAKPDWTKKPVLKTTEKGGAVKKGESLTEPVTHIRGKLVLAFEKDDAQLGENAKFKWEKPDWLDSEKPILKMTEKGAAVKKGESLTEPVTHIRDKVALAAESDHEPMNDSKSESAKYKWEKPEWIDSKKPVLRTTEKGAAVKKGDDITEPVTRIREKVALASESDHEPMNDSKSESAKYKWEKPEWLAPKLRNTEKGEIVKTKGDLQGAITFVEKKHMDDINFEANPMNLKSTDKGGVIRLGECLAKPITHIERDPMADVNFEANPAFVLHESDTGHAVKQGQTLAKPVTHVPKADGRDVNFEANPALLRKTQQGEIVKKQGDLQGPITHVRKEKDPMDDINYEANPNVLRPTDKGCMLRIGEDLARPITHIAKTIKSNVDEGGTESA